MNNKRLALLSILAIATIGLVVLMTVVHQKQASSTVYIRGLENCSKNIDSGRVATLGGDLYAYVKTANEYNKIKSLPTYEATVREDGCGTTTSNLTKDYNGVKTRVYTSTALVDIPEAKQSWQVQYDWMPDNSEKVDLGTLDASCPTGDNLKYGEFQCQKALNVLKHGTANYDPIMEYMPYSGEGFNLEYNPDAKQVTATILVPANQKGNQELLENNKAVVPYWFTKRGLDQSQYNIVYTVNYQ